MSLAKSGTLVAGVVTTVTIDTNGDDVQVENLDPSPDFTVIWSRSDGTNPTGLGTDGDFPVSGTRVFANNSGRRQMTLKLISSVSIPYSVSACVTA